MKTGCFFFLSAVVIKHNKCKQLLRFPVAAPVFPSGDDRTMVSRISLRLCKVLYSEVSSIRNKLFVCLFISPWGKKNHPET